MKIVIKINQSADISFGEIFQMRECVCACLSELNLSEEFYIPTSNQLSQNLHAASYLKIYTLHIKHFVEE